MSWLEWVDGIRGRSDIWQYAYSDLMKQYSLSISHPLIQRKRVICIFTIPPNIEAYFSIFSS